MPSPPPADPTTATPARIWSLLCDGVEAGSYTDHCNRPFMAGDILRDDHDDRRMVIALSEQAPFTLHVGPPDLAGPDIPAAS